MTNEVYVMDIYYGLESGDYLTFNSFEDAAEYLQISVAELKRRIKNKTAFKARWNEHKYFASTEESVMWTIDDYVF